MAGVSQEAAPRATQDRNLRQVEVRPGSHTRRSLASAVFLVAAVLCLAQALSKGVLWVAGERTSGTVVTQKKAATTRGAALVRYQFDAPSGVSYGGSAFTASRNALRARVDIAYLGFFPSLNMPAYGAYSALLAGVWTLLGLILLGLSRVVRRRLDEIEGPPEASSAQIGVAQQTDREAQHGQ